MNNGKLQCIHIGTSTPEGTSDSLQEIYRFDNVPMECGGPTETPATDRTSLSVKKGVTVPQGLPPDPSVGSKIPVNEEGLARTANRD